MNPANATRYSDLYRDLPDVLQGTYAGYLAPFGPESQDANAELRDRVLEASGHVPKIYAILQTEPELQISFIHRPTIFAPSFAGVTQWDGGTFAFLGDVGVGNQLTVVEFPTGNPGAFGRCVPVTVPTTANMSALWAAAAGVDMLGPYAVNAADTELIRARYAVPIPKPYVEFCLVRGTFTPRTFWTDVISQVLLDNRAADCAVLVDWARVVSTYGAADQAGNPTIPLGAGNRLRVPLADDALKQAVWQWTIADIPKLAQQVSPIEAQFLQQNLTLNQMFQRQVDDAAAARAAAAAPKSVGTVYPQAVGMLTNMCGVGTEAALPPFWQRMANCKKKEGINVLQAMLHDRAETPGAFPHVPVVTPEVYDAISEFRFGSTNMDDLLAGLNPFVISNGADADEAQYDRQRSANYITMFMGNAAPTLGEVQELRACAPRMCHTTNDLECTYQGLSLLYDVLFGPDHLLCSTFRVYIQQYMAMKSTLENNFRAPGEIQMLVQRLQRHTQLRCVHYLNVAPRLGVTAAGDPDFNDAIRALNFRNWQSLPYIPRRYWLPQTPPKEQKRGDVPPAETPLAPKTPPSRGSSVQNPHPVGELKSKFQNSGRSLGEFTRGKTTPKAEDKSSDLCLSYILRGSCTKECRRAATHRALTASETASVKDFLKQALE